MKRYAIRLSTYVFVDAENVAQAVSLTKKHVRVIGKRSGCFKTRNDRDMTCYRIALSDIRFGRPLRLVMDDNERV